MKIKPCPICQANNSVFERTLNNIELVKCGQCHFVYANIADDYIETVNSEFDDNSICSYAEHQTFIDRMWFERIAKTLVAKCGHGKVLDVGCGNGLLLKNFLDNGWSTFGVDMSGWSKEFADRYGFTFYQGQIEQAGLQNDYFDIITNTSVLEHVSNPCQYVVNLMRLLKPGGVAYFAGMPNYGSLAVRLNISDFRNNRPPMHCNYFTYQTVRHLFSSPQIAAKTEKLHIASYGIPELHRFYGFLQKVVHKFKFSKQISKSILQIDNKNEVKQPGAEGLIYKILAKILVPTYYYLGRPFHLGDKLEVTAVKRQQVT